MSNIKYISEKIKKGESVYLYEDLREVVMEITPQYKCYVKQKGGKAYLIDSTTKTVADAELGGEIINEEKYKNF